MSGASSLRLLMRLAQGRTARIFAVRTLGVGALFALDVSLGRILGVEGYGSFAFILVVATVIAHLAPLGWLNAVTRLVRGYLDDRRTDLLKGSLITAHATSVLGLGIAALLLLAMAHLGGAEGQEALSLLRLALPLGMALTAVELHRYILRGQHAGVLGEALPMLLLPLGVLGALWGLRLQSVDAVVFAHVGVGGLLVLLSASRIRSRLPPGLRGTPPAFRLRSWSLMAAAMLVGTASDELTARAAVLMLGTFSSDEATGLYQAAARLSLLTIFILRAVTASTAPRIAELYHAGDTAELRKVYARAALVSACGAAPLLLFFGVWPEFALSLFGSGFSQGAPILQVLVAGYFVAAATGPAATSLMMIGRERTYGLVATGGLVLNLGGMAVLVPMFHALGAALVTATVLIIVNLFYAATLWHTIRPVPLPVNETPAPAPPARPLGSSS